MLLLPSLGPPRPLTRVPSFLLLLFFGWFFLSLVIFSRVVWNNSASPLSWPAGHSLGCRGRGNRWRTTSWGNTLPLAPHFLSSHLCASTCAPIFILPFLYSHLRPHFQPPICMLPFSPSHFLSSHFHPPTCAPMLYAPIMRVPIFYRPTCAHIFMLPLALGSVPPLLSFHLRPYFHPPKKIVFNGDTRFHLPPHFLPPIKMWNPLLKASYFLSSHKRLSKTWRAKGLNYLWFVLELTLISGSCKMCPACSTNYVSKCQWPKTTLCKELFIQNQ